MKQILNHLAWSTLCFYDVITKFANHGWDYNFLTFIFHNCVQEHEATAKNCLWHLKQAN